ncbi:MAG: MATE family efflux transporter, partial [Clostridium sp.]
TGAAVTTLISNTFMFIMFHIVSKGMFKINLKDGIDYEKIKEIAKLGLPMSFQRVLFTIVNIALARIVAKFGSDAIAAQKIGLQIESVVFMIVGGLNGAIASFVGQNYGAKKFKRINEGYNTALVIGVIYATITMVIFIFTPEIIVKIFIREETTIKIASDYLRIIGFSQIFSTIEMISNGVFTGLGLPKISATVSILFTVTRIPIALVLINYLGVNGIWWSISISSICKGLSVYLIYKLKIGKEYGDVKCS